MRSRIVTCLLALGLTACTSALEAIAPRAFYGRLVSADDSRLCLADPRQEDPDAQRCFARGYTTLPDGVEEGDILNVRYELGDEGEEETALTITPVAGP
jgi:hypothetical protein